MSDPHRETHRAVERAARTSYGRLVALLAAGSGDLQLAQDSIQRKVLDFDPTGDTHYDLASAFIKSLRGSDPQAAVYWLARMLEGGEDPRFVARRLVIFASEDVGNADPQGLLVANAAWDAVEKVGLPECRLNLAQAVTYLATAPKSNAATLAIGAAVLGFNLVGDALRDALDPRAVRRTDMPTDAGTPIAGRR